MHAPFRHLFSRLSHRAWASLCLLATLSLTGCTFDEDEAPPPFYAAPVITSTGPTAGIHRVEGIVSLPLSLNANGFLNRLEVTLNGAPYRTFLFELNDGATRGLPFIDSIPLNAVLGSTRVLSFVLFDRKGQRSAPFTYTATVDPNFIPSQLTLTDISFAGQSYRRISGALNVSQSLPAGFNYLLLDTLRVLDGGALTLAPGVTIFGTGANATDTAFVEVSAGGRIIANGNSTQPIVFTSRAADPRVAGSPQPGDWGGIRIQGTGGTTSSGVLRYVRIEYTGSQFFNPVTASFDDNRALRLNNVGSGTLVEYLQTFRTQNDGIRLSGGTVNLRRVIITDHGATGIRWQDGWEGNMQFIVCHTSTVKPWNAGLTRDIRGESTTSFGRVANVTLLGPAPTGASTARGFRLESGPSRAQVIGLLATNYPNNAIRTDGASAFITAGSVRLSNSHAWNGSALWHSTTDPLKTLHGNSEGNNMVGTMSGVGGMSFVGIFPGSMLNPTTLGAWFESAPYAGAVDPANDWTANGSWARNADGSIR